MSRRSWLGLGWRGLRWGSAALVFAGCGPIIVAWPPNQVMPTAMAPMEDKAELGFGVGSNFFLAYPLMFPTEGGPAHIYGGYAPWEGADLRLAAAPYAFGSGYDLRLGQRAWANETFRLDAVLGVGLSWSESTGPFYVGTYMDADEDGIQDLEPVTETRDYAYWTLAPSLAARFTWSPGADWRVPVVARLSRASTFTGYGLEGWDPRVALWYDLDAAVVHRVGEHWTLGASLGVTTDGAPAFSMGKFGLSAGVHW